MAKGWPMGIGRLDRDALHERDEPGDHVVADEPETKA
jgi:hypothetical protein